MIDESINVSIDAIVCSFTHGGRDELAIWIPEENGYLIFNRFTWMTSGYVMCRKEELKYTYGITKVYAVFLKTIKKYKRRETIKFQFSK